MNKKCVWCDGRGYRARCAACGNLVGMCCASGMDCVGANGGYGDTADETYARCGGTGVGRGPAGVPPGSGCVACGALLCDDGSCLGCGYA